MTYYLFLLLTFFLIGRPQDFFTSLASMRPALVLTLITLSMTLLGSGKDSINAAFRAKESKKYALFYMMMILSIPLAAHRRFAFEFTILVYLSSILYYFIFLINVDTIKKMKTVIFIMCCSILFYCALGVIKGNEPTGRAARYAAEGIEVPGSDRLHFGIYDPNDLAFFLVSLSPLSIYFIVQKEGLFKKVLGLATVGVSVIIILLTGSRGGFLGLLCVAAVFFLKRSGGIKRSTKILLALAGAAIIAGYGYKINIERYSSLSNVGSDYNVTAADGRLAIWKKGILLIISNPVTGIGVNCFPKAIGDLRAEMGEIPKWQAPHNSYIQVAAETGLIGLFFFYSLIAGSLRLLSFTLKSSIENPHAGDLKAIAASVQLGFIGSVIIAFFLTQAYSVVFTLFFALSTVIRQLSSTRSESVNPAGFVAQKI